MVGGGKLLPWAPAPDLTPPSRHPPPPPPSPLQYLHTHRCTHFDLKVGWRLAGPVGNDLRNSHPPGAMQQKGALPPAPPSLGCSFWHRKPRQTPRCGWPCLQSGNVLLTAEITAKLSDVGLARCAARGMGEGLRRRSYVGVPGSRHQLTRVAATGAAAHRTACVLLYGATSIRCSLLSPEKLLCDCRVMSASHHSLSYEGSVGTFVAMVGCICVEKAPACLHGTPRPAHGSLALAAAGMPFAPYFGHHVCYPM